MGDRAVKSSETKRFASDLVARALTEVISAVIGIITFSILARSLNKTEYAISNQLITLGGLLAPIILIKMNSAYCVFFPGQKNRTVLKSRFFSSVILTLPICFAVIILLLLFREFFSIAMFGTNEYANLIVIMAIYYILLALATLSQDFFRGIGSIKIASFLAVMNSVFKLLAFILLILQKKAITLEMILWSYLITEVLILIVALILIFHYFKGLKLKIEFKPLREYYKYALPLMPYLVLSWMNQSIGKFIINHLMGLEDSGVYVFNYSLVTRLFVITPILGYTIFPYISRFWNTGQKDMVSLYLSKAFNIGIFLGIPISFGLLAVQPTIVEILGGENYQVDKLLCGILCLAMIFNLLYSVFGYLIDLSRKTIWYTIILLITSIVNIGLNYLLIPILGIYGAAITMLIVYGMQAVLTIIIGVKAAQVKLRISLLYIVRVFAVSVAMYFITSLVYKNTSILNFILSIGVGGSFYFFITWIMSKITKKGIV